ncbi:MAG: hypothetical protein AAF710_01490 [Planctomycetota bacterium]
MARVPRLLLSLAPLLLLLPAGCAPPITLGQEQQRARLAALDYPADAPYGPDLDVVVRRDDRTLQLINRTPRRYADLRLWLNQQYVRDVPAIEVGPGNRYDLRRWINQHREPFPVAVLLAPDRAFPVVLAELHDPELNVRHRLLVWPDDTLD